MPVAGVGQHDLGITELDRAQLALGGADHRFQMPEVRRLGRDLGGQRDLAVVDHHLRVVALQRRLAVRADHARVVIGDIDQPLGASASSCALTIPGAIRRDPSAAIPRERQAS